MPPRKRPHRRSLDALFPRPKKPAVKRCPAGHRQTQKWKAGSPCLACDLDRERRERAALDALTASVEREEWSRKLNVGPVLTMVVTSTGQVIRHSIPPHLAAQKRAMDRRRGRARR